MTNPEVTGRVRESADGLRRKDSTQALKEAQTRLAKEAAAQRSRRKEEESRGSDKQGRLN